jgi:hypothetical protein
MTLTSVPLGFPLSLQALQVTRVNQPAQRRPHIGQLAGTHQLPNPDD